MIESWCIWFFGPNLSMLLFLVVLSIVFLLMILCITKCIEVFTRN